MKRIITLSLALILTLSFSASAGQLEERYALETAKAGKGKIIATGAGEYRTLITKRAGDCYYVAVSRVIRDIKDFIIGDQPLNFRVCNGRAEDIGKVADNMMPPGGEAYARKLIDKACKDKHAQGAYGDFVFIALSTADDKSCDVDLLTLQGDLLQSWITIDTCSQTWIGARLSQKGGGK